MVKSLTHTHVCTHAGTHARTTHTHTRETDKTSGNQCSKEPMTSTKNTSYKGSYNSLLAVTGTINIKIVTAIATTRWSNRASIPPFS